MWRADDGIVYLDSLRNERFSNKCKKNTSRSAEIALLCFVCPFEVTNIIHAHIQNRFCNFVPIALISFTPIRLNQLEETF